MPYTPVYETVPRVRYVGPGTWDPDFPYLAVLTFAGGRQTAQGIRRLPWGLWTEQQARQAAFDAMVASGAEEAALVRRFDGAVVTRWFRTDPGPVGVEGAGDAPRPACPPGVPGWQKAFHVVTEAASVLAAPVVLAAARTAAPKYRPLLRGLGWGMVLIDGFLLLQWFRGSRAPQTQ